MPSRGAERAPLLAGASRAAADDVEGGAQHPSSIRPSLSKAWTTKLAVGATLVAVGALIGGLTTSRDGASGSSTSLSSWLAGFAAPSSAEAREGAGQPGRDVRNHALDGVFAARYDSNESRDVASQSRGEGDDEGSR